MPLHTLCVGFGLNSVSLQASVDFTPQVTKLIHKEMLGKSEYEGFTDAAEGPNKMHQFRIQWVCSYKQFA